MDDDVIVAAEPSLEPWSAVVAGPPGPAHVSIFFGLRLSSMCSAAIPACSYNRTVR